MAIRNFAYALNAAADFSTAGQFRFVTINAAGDAALSSAGGDSEGVLQNNPVSGAAGTIWRGGISKVEAGGVVAIGDNIASDATGRGVVAVAGDAILGVAKAAAGAAGVFFDMVQTDRSDTGNGALSNVLADPGNAGALLVGGNGQTPIVSVGAAETRTMADATFAGQLRLLYFKTDAGDVTITFASPIDQLGRTTVVFDDIGEYVLLVAVEDGADIEWRVAGEADGRGSDENIIADPGTGVALPVTASGSIAITTAAAETNTLPDPLFIGQRLSLIIDVFAVGARVITAASGINQTGDTIMTMGAVEDAITLQAMQIAGALQWRVVFNDGVALS